VNAIVTGSLAAGPSHVDFEKPTASGDGSADVPFVRSPGSEALGAA
jgi:hypothetical protein